jgi:hypothetical protein
VSQAGIDTSELVCAGEFSTQDSISEGEMHTIPEVSTRAVPEAETSFVVSLMAVICGLGLIVFLCMATAGLDMSAGFF